MKLRVYLGRYAFVARTQRALGSMQREGIEVPRMQRRGSAHPLSHFAALKLPRDVAMAQAFATGAYSQAEIARVFGVHYATVSRAVARQAEPGVPDAPMKLVSRATE